MQARTRRAVQTRWLYNAESTVLKGNVYANCDMPMAYLRRLAKRVWDSEAPKGRRFPSIVAGAGLLWQKRFTSYCAGFTEIVLARHHRTVLVLLHEITHALGPCQHGKAFVKLYFRLLERYGRYDPMLLQGVAAQRGIALA